MHAQSFDPALFGGVAGPVYFNIEPQNPGPNQAVTATLTSFSTNLDSADISWFINGALDKRGVGIKTLSFQIGDLGKTTTVSVTIRTQEGSIVEKSISISPAEIEIFVEADSYTPPFYRGKALFAHQGDARIIALPRFVNSSGTRINPANLIYTWKKNGTVAQDASGFGKQSFSVEGTVIAKPIQLEVVVSTQDSSITGTARASLFPAGAKVLVYEESPLYGIRFGTAVTNNFDLSQDEATFTAIPYFFSAKSTGSILYSWLMNNQSAGVGGSVTFRNETGAAGLSQITVKAENTSKILQFGSKNFTVSFGEKASDSFLFR